MKKKAKIIVVEDDPAILNGLLDVLVFNGYDATGVEDGAEGLDRAVNENFDLAILDVMLPSMDGYTICRKLREKKPDQAVLMLTAKGAEDDVVQGFNAGADDYVSKPFSLRELLVRIEALLRRLGLFEEDEKLEVKGIVFDSANLIAVKDDIEVELTRREMEIISFLYKNRERIVSKKDLLLKVWNYADADIETRIVDIHMLKLRKKITRLIGDNPLITTVRGEGYRIKV